MKRGKHINNRGFSLVEALIVVGLIGISSMVFTTLYKMQLDATKHVETTAVVNDFFDYMKSSLLDQQICTSAFLNKTLAGTPPKASANLGTIRDRDGLTVLFQTQAANPAAAYVGGKLAIVDIYITREPPPNNNKFLLNVAVKKLNDKMGGQVVVRETPIYVGLAADNITITACGKQRINTNPINGQVLFQTTIRLNGEAPNPVRNPAESFFNLSVNLALDPEMSELTSLGWGGGERAHVWTWDIPIMIPDRRTLSISGSCHMRSRGTHRNTIFAEFLDANGVMLLGFVVCNATARADNADFVTVATSNTVNYDIPEDVTTVRMRLMHDVVDSGNINENRLSAVIKVLK